MENRKIEIPHPYSSTQGLKAVVMSDFEQFNGLYKKYVDGSRWLKEQAIRGNDVSRDLQDFTSRVVKPMQEVWFKLTDEERQALKIF